MAAVKVSDEEFEAVAGAALEAASMGDMGEPRPLESLAKKIKTALSRDQRAANLSEQLLETILDGGVVAERRLEA